MGKIVKNLQKLAKITRNLQKLHKIGAFWTVIEVPPCANLRAGAQTSDIRLQTPDSRPILRLRSGLSLRCSLRVWLRQTLAQMIEFSFQMEEFSETASGSRLRLGTPYCGAETTPQVSQQKRRRNKEIFVSNAQVGRIVLFPCLQT
jgi:hypothetical protein